jgi:hypothetical protein
MRKRDGVNCSWVVDAQDNKPAALWLARRVVDAQATDQAVAYLLVRGPVRHLFHELIVDGLSCGFLATWGRSHGS